MVDVLINDEDLFMCFLAICASTLVKGPFE